MVIMYIIWSELMCIFSTITKEMGITFVLDSRVLVQVVQMKVFFTLLKLCLATATHNFKRVKMSVLRLSSLRLNSNGRVTR